MNRGYRELLDGRLKWQIVTILENSFDKDKSVGLYEIVDTKKIMICALCEKLWQHNFAIAIVVKLPINGLSLEEFNEKFKIFKN